VTDADLVSKKLARIESCGRELRTLVDAREIETDLRAERFAEHTLQIAIQAALDVASHIVSDERLGEPSTNRELVEILGRAGRLPAGMVPTLRDMVGFRNLLVHGYDTVDPAIVRESSRRGSATWRPSSTACGRSSRRRRETDLRAAARPEAGRAEPRSG